MYEVEVRSFLSEDKYRELLEELDTEEDEQVTYYFEGDKDLRIQKNNSFSKIWMKKGELHSDAREEIEVQVPREDFELLHKLFRELGYDVEIKWHRIRNTCTIDGIDTAIDFSKGYGYILELEKLVETEGEIEEVQKELEEVLEELGIEETDKEAFDEAYEWYRDNWEEAIGRGGPVAQQKVLQ